MILALNVLWGLLLAVISLALCFGVFFFWKKSQIESSVSIQCSSGDSEVMIFNHNFLAGESEESKASKVHSAFESIQHRRDENHAKYLQIKADAIEENLAKKPEDLKLRSIVE